jgi:spermidine synthase
MRIARPWQLELEYQQQMMAVALFLPRPRRILQLGLGAAALTKFCYRHLPEAQLTAVELSTEVIDVTRQWFALPEDDERLQVVHREARDYLGALRAAGRTDWLQVDLYDAGARGPVHDDVGFYRLSRRALRRPGIACFNLFGGRFDPSFRAIAAAFDDRVLAGPELDEGNRIVFGMASRFDLSMSLLVERAADLESAWRMPFRRWLRQMAELNGISDRLRL